MGDRLPGGALDPRRDPGRPCRAAPRRRGLRSSMPGGSACGCAAATPAGPARTAIAAASTFDPALQASGTTFTGAVRLESADAADCLFLDGLEVVQTQEGCLRQLLSRPGPHDAAGPSADVPLRAVPRPDVRVGRLRGRRLLRARARARSPAAVGRGRRRRGRRLPPRSARGPGRRAAAAHPRVRPARPASGLDHGFLGGMMTGDYTKVPLRLDDRWTGARMQQGRVLLDHEWNLNLDASARAAQAAAADIIGFAGVVAGTPDFEVAVTPSGTLDLNVQPGRIWVAGMLAFAPAPFTYSVAGSDRGVAGERPGARLPRCLRGARPAGRGRRARRPGARPDRHRRPDPHRLSGAARGDDSDHLQGRLGRLRPRSRLDGAALDRPHRARRAARPLRAARRPARPASRRALPRRGARRRQRGDGAVRLVVRERGGCGRGRRRSRATRSRLRRRLRSSSRTATASRSPGSPAAPTASPTARSTPSRSRPRRAPAATSSRSSGR